MNNSNSSTSWDRSPFEPANRSAALAATNPFKPSPINSRAMDLDRRPILRPKSQWSRAISRRVLWPNHYPNGRADTRRTEPMLLEDDNSRTTTSRHPSDRAFWSFYNPSLTSPSSARPKRKQAAADTPGLVAAYESALRRTAHANQQAALGTWYHLFTGEPAEQLMYWYHQGMSLQALTFLAKSDRLRANAGRVLLAGRETEMVKNFIYARAMNPQDTVRGDGIGAGDGGRSKRLKTQEEEDATFICTEPELGRGLARAGGRSGGGGRETNAERGRRLSRRLPPGVLARTRVAPFKLYREGGRSAGSHAVGAVGLGWSRHRPLAAPGCDPGVVLVIEDYADPRRLYKLVDTRCVEGGRETAAGRRARALAMDPGLSRVEGWERMWRRG